MSQLTLVQKRALLAVTNDLKKIRRAENEVKRIHHASLNSMGRPTQNTPRLALEVAAMKRKWREGLERFLRLERKLGVTNFDTKNVMRNILSDVIKKHGGLALIRKKLWLKGLEAEMERARANFRNFEKGVFHQKSNLIGESHRKKTPSPPKRVSPPRRTSPPPANNAHRRVHGIGPANNARITWSRNANGKISIHKTLTNLNLGLTNAQRMVLESMPQNQAINAIRQMARQR